MRHQKTVNQRIKFLQSQIVGEKKKKKGKRNDTLIELNRKIIVNLKSW